MILKELLLEEQDKILETIRDFISSGSSRGARDLRIPLAKENGAELFYVATYDDDGVEAYVIVENGKHTFKEESSRRLYVNDEYQGMTGRDADDAIDDVVQNFRLEGGKTKPGAIEALRDVLNGKFDQYDE